MSAPARSCFSLMRRVQHHTVSAGVSQRHLPPADQVAYKHERSVAFFGVRDDIIRVRSDGLLEMRVQAGALADDQTSVETCVVLDGSATPAWCGNVTQVGSSLKVAAADYVPGEHMFTLVQGDEATHTLGTEYLDAMFVDIQPSCAVKTVNAGSVSVALQRFQAAEPASVCVTLDAVPENFADTTCVAVDGANVRFLTLSRRCHA